MSPDAYKRPAGRRTITPRRRDREGPAVAPPPVLIAPEVDRATECHVTPPEICARMVDYLGPCGDFQTLEPSTGTGNLVAALVEAGQPHLHLTCIERHPGLWQHLGRRFPGQIAGFNRCFLDYAEEAAQQISFSRIIMNPPFSKVRQHMDAARKLSGCDGHDRRAIVALVPITYTAADFETMEELPPDTFTSAPGVRTKIIMLDEDR